MSRNSKRRHQHLSQPKRIPGSQCLGKLRYRNQEAADKAIREMNGYARAYRCHICHRLHLTSKPLKGAA